MEPTQKQSIPFIQRCPRSSSTMSNNADSLLIATSPYLKKIDSEAPCEGQSKLLFYEWLYLQMPRNDVIGDLAKNVLTDPAIKLIKNHLDAWHTYLKSRATSSIKLLILRYAWSEYQQFLILWNR